MFFIEQSIKSMKSGPDQLEPQIHHFLIRISTFPLSSTDAHVGLFYTSLAGSDSTAGVTPLQVWARSSRSIICRIASSARISAICQERVFAGTAGGPLGRDPAARPATALAVGYSQCSVAGTFPQAGLDGTWGRHMCIQRGFPLG